MNFDTLPAFLDHWADTRGDKIWMRDLRADGSEDYSWGEARRQINQVAAALEKRFGNGANMIILSRNRPHWFMADMAVIRSGNVTVSMFTTLPANTAQYIAEFTEAKVLFLGESANWDSVQGILPADVTIVTLPGVEIEAEHLSWEQLLDEGLTQELSYVCKPDDIMSLVFTSGTTGLPKGVIQTHGSNIIPVRRFVSSLGVRDQPRYLSYLPLSHIAERQIVQYGSLYSCGEVDFNESMGTLLRDLQLGRPHIFFGPPRIWEQFQQAVIGKFGGQEALDAALKDDPHGVGKRVLEAIGLEEVECCLTAAAPIPPPLVEWWSSMGLTLLEGFGQTEAMSLILNRHSSRCVGSIGKPLGEVEYKLTDEGELAVKAEGLTPGYYKQPEKTAELFQDGWLHTGDKARVDDNGFIFLTGRVKDYFKTIQGKFVAPSPIEGQFAVNPYVEQQCLMGRGFSKTVIVAVLTDDAKGKDREKIETSIRETLKAINSSIEKHARIGAVIISDDPWTIENGVLTPTLKIRRDKIDEMFAELGERLARQSAEQGLLLVHWS